MTASLTISMKLPRVSVTRCLTLLVLNSAVRTVSVMASSLSQLKGKEWLYTYRNSQQISMQTGLIGYIRADMEQTEMSSGQHGTAFVMI